MAATLAGRVKIRAQLIAVIGMRAALDDQRRPFARRQATQVRIAPLRDQHVDVMFWGIVQVGLSFQSHDPSQRSNGFLTLAGGVIITFAKEILNLIVG